MLKDTSLQAYIQINAEGVTGTQRTAIYGTIQRHEGLTRNEIQRLTKIPINAVCGRCNELLKSEHIYEEGRRLDKDTGKENYILKATGVK